MIGNRRGRRSIKLLKWISRYSGYWHLICTPGDEHMNMVTARNIVKCLARNGLYEFIFVFLSVHREEEFVKSMLCLSVWILCLRRFSITAWMGLSGCLMNI